MQLTTTGLVHSVLAALCIVIGLVQLVGRKGSPSHRMLGYVFVVSMLIVNISTLSVRRFTGGFNIFHVEAGLNLACVVAAMLPMLRRPRPSNWLLTHYRWMAGAYIGLIAAGLTELVVRLGPFATKTQLWTASAAVGAIVTIVGCGLIARYRPRRMPVEER